MFMNEVLPEPLQALEACNANLYLTGSRHFGNWTATSDWDFFCADIQENREALRSVLKWTVVENRKEDDRGDLFNPDSIVYNDANTVEVWAHFGVVSIHIQFIKNVEVKLTAQRMLHKFPFSAIEKNMRRHVWNWAMKNAADRIVVGRL